MRESVEVRLPYLDTPTTTTPVTSHVYVVEFFELFSWADQKVKKLSKFSPFRKLLQLSSMSYLQYMANQEILIESELIDKTALIQETFEMQLY